MKDVEKDIIRYIEDNEDEDYSEVLKSDKRWEVFYHLSPTRAAIVDWYDFGKDAEVLEVGGEFGAITGRLCDKVRNVTVSEKKEYRAKAIEKRYTKRKNLFVFSGDVLHLTYEKKYDYIFLNDVLEICGEGTDTLSVYANFLKAVSMLLKEQGKILFAVENRLGIKYFCGVKEKYSNVAFYGINRYPEKVKGRTFSKFEITQILKKAQIEDYKFYYPMPDYITPQVIYSDHYLPGSNINERVTAYYPKEDPLLIVENIAYKDLAENNMFGFMANSFFVECCYHCKQSLVDFATITADRGVVHGQVTAICHDKTVKKYAISEQGNDIIKLCYENIQFLAQRGVNIVPHSFGGDIIVMPYINELPLSEKIQEIAFKEPEEFITIFDILYENILCSAEHVNVKLNNLSVASSVPELGVILEKAFIDMIPFNCFYVDKKCIYFDQEFVRDYYPAKYVLFRAVMYTYLHNPSIEKIVSIDELKKRYELDKLWDIFKEEERRFVSENRNRKQYSQLYQWTDVKSKEIFERDKKIADLIM